MNELHLFAGGGGGILGGLLLGHRPVCAVENNKNAQKVLLARQQDGILPQFPIWDDVKTFDGTPWKNKIDILCGGFPCQDISSSGRGQGLSGAKSGLWSEMLRIANQIRPQYIFIENSPLLVKRGLITILRDLTQLGYDTRWCILGAASFGGWQIRKRCWVLAYPASQSITRESVHKLTVCSRDSSRLQTKILQSTWNGRQSGLYWESEPNVDRVADGLAHGVDKRNAILGNGQIPIVAAAAWSILISEHEHY